MQEPTLSARSTLDQEEFRKQLYGSEKNFRLRNWPSKSQAKEDSVEIYSHKKREVEKVNKRRDLFLAEPGGGRSATSEYDAFSGKDGLGPFVLHSRVETQDKIMAFASGLPMLDKQQISIRESRHLYLVDIKKAQLTSPALPLFDHLPALCEISPDGENGVVCIDGHFYTLVGGDWKDIWHVDDHEIRPHALWTADSRKILLNCGDAVAFYNIYRDEELSTIALFSRLLSWQWHDETENEAICDSFERPFILSCRDSILRINLEKSPHI